jgi:hypothetical protein
VDGHLTLGRHVFFCVDFFDRKGFFYGNREFFSHRGMATEG